MSGDIHTAGHEKYRHVPIVDPVQVFEIAATSGHSTYIFDSRNWRSSNESSDPCAIICKRWRSLVAVLVDVNLLSSLLTSSVGSAVGLSLIHI